ncbi:MAG: hypothetical protein ACQEXQ_29800 [Bacillota bacterium]
MKLSTLIIMIFITITFVFTGCTTDEPDFKQNVVVSNEEGSMEITEETSEEASEKTNEQSTENTAVNDFALSINDTFINLKDWDYELNLAELFGTPISQDVEEIRGAGQLTGSFIKRTKYDGLQFELFSPQQNGKDFWIMTMEVTKKGFKTSRGIEIGNTVDEVKDAYPRVEIALDGRTDPNNCAYVIKNEDQYNFLQFEVKEGLISGMKIYHLIP